MWERIDAGLRAAFREPRRRCAQALPQVLQQVRAGQLLPSVAARRLLREMGLEQPVEATGCSTTTTSVKTTR